MQCLSIVNGLAQRALIRVCMSRRKSLHLSFVARCTTRRAAPRSQCNNATITRYIVAKMHQMPRRVVKDGHIVSQNLARVRASLKNNLDELIIIFTFYSFHTCDVHI